MKPTRSSPSLLLSAALSATGLAAFSGLAQTPPGSTPVVPAARAPDPEPFIDRFRTLDIARWKVSDGWRNGEWTVNDWRASQAGFGKGMVLTLAENRTDLAAYSSGELQSRRTFGHGYFETRMRAARGIGVVTGFFTYTGPPFGRPWDEIDVEIIGRKPREVMFTYFRDGEKESKIVPLGFDATSREHVYGFDWQPGAIRWYVDGKLVHEATGKTLALPRERQMIMASVWASQTLNRWLGRFDPRMLPTSARFTCIAYSPDFAGRKGC